MTIIARDDHGLINKSQYLLPGRRHGHRRFGKAGLFPINEVRITLCLEVYVRRFEFPDKNQFQWLLAQKAQDEVMWSVYLPILPHAGVTV